MSKITRFYDNAAGPHLLLDATNDRVIVIYDPAYTGEARGRFAGGATMYEAPDGRTVRAVLWGFSAGVSLRKLPMAALILELLREAASYGYFSVGWPAFDEKHLILGYVPTEADRAFLDAR